MRILVPFDGSDPSKRALDYALRIGGSIGKESVSVHLLNVQEADASLADFFARDAADVAARIASSRRDAGTRLLAEPTARAEGAGVRVEGVVLIGDAATVIASYVDSHRCDMLVMGTRGLGPVGGWVLGSVASKVIHLVNVPITLVK